MPLNQIDIALSILWRLLFFCFFFMFDDHNKDLKTDVFDYRSSSTNEKVEQRRKEDYSDSLGHFHGNPKYNE